MYGFIVFPANPKEKDYKFKKEPKKALKMTNEEALQYTKGVKEIYYSFYHFDNKDNLTDIEKIESFKEHWGRDYSNLKKVRGYDGYTNDKNEFYIKVITEPREWFKLRNF